MAILTLKSFKAQSANILSTFTKTKEELIKLNYNLLQSIDSNNTIINKLQEENNQLTSLVTQHDSVISNINNFLGANE